MRTDTGDPDDPHGREELDPNLTKWMAYSEELVKTLTAAQDLELASVQILRVQSVLQNLVGESMISESIIAEIESIKLHLKQLEELARAMKMNARQRLPLVNKRIIELAAQEVESLGKRLPENQTDEGTTGT